MAHLRASRPRSGLRLAGHHYCGKAAFFIESYGVSVGETGLILGVVAAPYLPGNYLGRRLLGRIKAPTLMLAFAVAASVGVAIFQPSTGKRSCWLPIRASARLR